MLKVSVWDSQMTLKPKITIVIILLILFFTAGGALAQRVSGTFDPNLWFSDYFKGMSTELLGAIAIFWLLDNVLEGERAERERQEKQAEEEEREKRNRQERQTELAKELTGQLGSRLNDVARHAAEKLRHHGWLRDGSLKQVWLHNANLARADLSFAHLTEAQLVVADLRGTDLSHSTLERTVFLKADASQANLIDANLREAKFLYANLRGANLEGADFCGADLTKADLLLAVLAGWNLEPNEDETQRWLKPVFKVNHTHFDENTILPDGSRWTLETDMMRFVNPRHPQFWRNDDPLSPASRAYFDPAEIWDKELEQQVTVLERYYEAIDEFEKQVPQAN
jgi:uncharacterized protein YjbI with pentapeptide repeats